jgi:hypothetical protein
MKSQPPATGTSDRPSSASSKVQEAGRESKVPEYKVEVSYYGTMRPQRVYPLVVEVPRGKGALALDAPTGIVVVLRPVVPGALVTPAELAFEVSRPGARALFYVTPLARGRLPEASVRVLYDRRVVQEVPARMRVRAQGLTWALLLLALLVPPVLIHYTHYAPWRDQVLASRPVLKKAEPAPHPQGAQPGGGPGVGAPVEVPKPDTEEYWRLGAPGEVMTDRAGRWLQDNIPDVPGSRRASQGLAAAIGTTYGALCESAPDTHPGFWLGVLFLLLACASWLRRRPARVRWHGTVALAGGPSSLTLHSDQTAETLPLAPPD